MPHPTSHADAKRAEAKLYEIIGPRNDETSTPVLDLMHYFLRTEFDMMPAENLPTPGKIDAAIEHARKLCPSQLHPLLSLCGRHVKAVVARNEPAPHSNFLVRGTCQLCNSTVAKSDKITGKIMRGAVYHDACVREMFRKAIRLLAESKPNLSPAMLRSLPKPAPSLHARP